MPLYCSFPFVLCSCLCILSFNFHSWCNCRFTFYVNERLYFIINLLTYSLKIVVKSNAYNDLHCLHVSWLQCHKRQNKSWTQCNIMNALTLSMHLAMLAYATEKLGSLIACRYRHTLHMQHDQKAASWPSYLATSFQQLCTRWISNC